LPRRAEKQLAEWRGPSCPLMTGAQAGRTADALPASPQALCGSPFPMSLSAAESGELNRGVESEALLAQFPLSRFAEEGRGECPGRDANVERPSSGAKARRRRASSTPCAATFSRKREKGVAFIRWPRADRSAGIIDGRERLDKLVRTLRSSHFQPSLSNAPRASLSPFGEARAMDLHQTPTEATD
jgi:hypothetical protein